MRYAFLRVAALTASLSGAGCATMGPNIGFTLDNDTGPATTASFARAAEPRNEPNPCKATFISLTNVCFSTNGVAEPKAKEVPMTEMPKVQALIHLLKTNPKEFERVHGKLADGTSPQEVVTVRKAATQGIRRP